LDQSWTQQLKSTWSKWTKYRKREQNLLLRLDLLIWCLISKTTIWTNMLWQIVLSLIHSSTKTTNKTSEALKVNHLLKE
jgi:hypothetical protein